MKSKSELVDIIIIAISLSWIHIITLHIHHLIILTHHILPSSTLIYQLSLPLFLPLHPFTLKYNPIDEMQSTSSMFHIVFVMTLIKLTVCPIEFSISVFLTFPKFSLVSFPTRFHQCTLSMHQPFFQLSLITTPIWPLIDSVTSFYSIHKLAFKNRPINHIHFVPSLLLTHLKLSSVNTTIFTDQCSKTIINTSLVVTYIALLVFVDHVAETTQLVVFEKSFHIHTILFLIQPAPSLPPLLHHGTFIVSELFLIILESVC